MKKILIAISALAAMGGLVLRRLQLAGSFDNSGLLVRNDGTSIALYSLCAVAVALVALLCLREAEAGGSGYQREDEGSGHSRGFGCAGRAGFPYAP